MRNVKWVVLGLLPAASLLVSGGARAEVPEMFGCGVVARNATVEKDGSVIQRVTAARVAQYYLEHCDLIALGRFSAVTIVDYDRARPRDVEALFTIDEVLLGPELGAVKVSMEGGMLVRPGGRVSRNAAVNVQRREGVVRLDLYEAIVEDLRDLHGMGAPLTEERLKEMEEKVGRLWQLTRTGPVDRVTAVTGWVSSVSHGTTFSHEGGAVAPHTQFLVGLDAHENPGPDRLNGIYSLIHWGDYAAAVAEAIRAGNQPQPSGRRGPETEAVPSEG